MEPFSTAIRKDAGVLGIKVGTVEHKLGLYADNVLLLLSDPHRLLASVSRIIQEFGELSLYKVNAVPNARHTHTPVPPCPYFY